ncbi:hypothetical protein AT3G59435 [Arabidopsis thaliana]|uniref:Uncharacterized protein n=1 Tax=Arabidopsis thaliana TaxID=3702 RepID=A0A1I9LMS4_ARATH|nr:uncharacterized protein AT3G59435 [Arabidopsis thaliana]ANM63882.1 hypothetical protein AT3G59435 [Arabidopsis thaliana]|eukprot:NP_001325945.1 hypothetical protein AT3G59435 [Arabidopsis thaliana]
MGFFNSGSTMFVDKSIKKIKALQKDIVKLNNSIEGVATSEEYWLDQAATSLAVSRKYGGIYEPLHLERKEKAEKEAKYHATLRLYLQKELGFVERLQQKHIDKALQHRDFTTAQKTRQFCFFFNFTCFSSF